MKSLSLFTKNLPGKNNFRLSTVFEKKFLEEAKKLNVTKQYQLFGIWIAQNLNDYKNIPLYIKLAKEQDKVLLESAISFIKDYPNAKSKTKLFFWYLKGKLKKKGRSGKLKKEYVYLFSKYKTKKTSKKLVITRESPCGNEKTIAVSKDGLLNEFEKDKYFGIYKLDLYSEKFKIGIDLIETEQQNLASKLYLKKKEDFLKSKNIKYYVFLKNSFSENPKEFIEKVLNVSN